MWEGLWERDAQRCGEARLQDGLCYLNLISFKKKSQSTHLPKYIHHLCSSCPVQDLSLPWEWCAHHSGGAQATPRGWAGRRVVPGGDLSHWERPCPGHADPLQPRPLRVEHVTWTALFTAVT